MANVLDTDYSFLNLPTAGSNVPGPINLPKFDPNDFTFSSLKNRIPVENLVASRMFPLSGPNNEGMNNNTSVGAIEKLGATLGKQVADLQSQIDELTAENNSLLAERDSVVSQLEQVTGAQQAFSSQAENYENTIADLQNQILELQNVQQPPVYAPPPPPPPPVDVIPVDVPDGGGIDYGGGEGPPVLNKMPPREQPPAEDFGFGPGIRRSEDFFRPEDLKMPPPPPNQIPPQTPMAPIMPMAPAKPILPPTISKPNPNQAGIGGFLGEEYGRMMMR